MITYGETQVDVLAFDTVGEELKGSQVSHKHGDYIYYKRTYTGKAMAQVNVNSPSTYKYLATTNQCFVTTSNEGNIWSNSGDKINEADFENSVYYSSLSIGNKLIWQIDDVVYKMWLWAIGRYDATLLQPTDLNGSYLGSTDLGSIWNNSNQIPLDMTFDTANNMVWILFANHPDYQNINGFILGYNYVTHAVHSTPVGRCCARIEMYGDYIIVCNNSGNPTYLYPFDSLIAIKRSDIIADTVSAKTLSQTLYDGMSAGYRPEFFTISGTTAILGTNKGDEKIYSFEIGDIESWDDGASFVDDTREVWRFNTTSTLEYADDGYRGIFVGDGKLFTHRQTYGSSNYISGMTSYLLPPLEFVDRVLIDTLAAIGIIWSAGNMQGQITELRTALNRGFVYGEASDALSNEIIVAGVNTDVFGYTYDELSPNTTYYYKAFSEDSYGRVLGTLASFLTLVRASKVEGNLSILDGSAAIGAEVICINMTTGLIHGTVTTDDKGFFTFTTNTEDKYIIIAYGVIDNEDYIYSNLYIESEPTE